jgi:DNA-binding GntR family transcriptional regulator
MNIAASGTAPSGLAALNISPVRTRQFGYDQVYRVLRRALLTQQIPQGTRLFEAEVADRLGVSRTPVREAMRRLESDGFVIRGRGGGLEATRMTPTEVDDIFLIRGELDRLAATLASQRGTPQDWDSIRDQVHAMDSAIISYGQTSEVFNERHLAVHASIYRIAFGPRLAGTLSNHILHYTAIAADLSYAEPHRTLPAVAQHDHLLTAIASGDPARAAAAAAEHVQRSARDATKASTPPEGNGNQPPRR